MNDLFYFMTPNASQKRKFCGGTVATADGGCSGFSRKINWKAMYTAMKSQVYVMSILLRHSLLSPVVSEK